MYRDYSKKNVNFYYVYSNIQHPEINGFVPPYNLKERQLHIAELKKRSGTKMPWLCDSMDNKIKAALHAAPNGEYIFDPQGELLVKRFWSDPNKLREDLEHFVGTVDKVTKVKDLETVFKVEPRKIASGVLKPLNLPAGLVPLIVKPIKNPIAAADSQPFSGLEAKDSIEKAAPYYIKLRAEIERKSFEAGTGKLYLGFYVDPLYKVHWNNAAGAVEVQLEGSKLFGQKQKRITALKPKEAADIDPRQFLIDIQNVEPNKVFSVTISCMICDDAETFCIPVTQRFQVKLTRNRYGGTRPGVFLPQMFANVKRFDRNKDGIITMDELPEFRKSLYIGHMDKNNDQTIDQKEIEEFMKMFNNGKGFTSPRNDGHQMQR